MHREIALAVEEATAPPAWVLELGAGGGQMAVALADLGYDVVAIEVVPVVAARAQDWRPRPDPA
jgi:protein-L-isoaspartate O-methyltransferase